MQFPVALLATLLAKMHHNKIICHVSCVLHLYANTLIQMSTYRKEVFILNVVTMSKNDKDITNY